MTDREPDDIKDALVPEQYVEADAMDAEESFRLADEDVPAAIEALLFASGDPVSLEKLQQITGVERHTLQDILSSLSSRYTRDRNRGLALREIDGSYLLCTKPEQKAVLQRLFQPRHRPPLSQAAYETLAIIAYNQPVTRAQVESVRGVNSDNIIARLIERNLVEETGSLDAPGRPLLFATTNQFLLDFGLRSVKELPPMELLMYGTLRDFEESLEEASGHQRDKQITIDQLVQAFVPGLSNSGSADLSPASLNSANFGPADLSSANPDFANADPSSTGLPDPGVPGDSPVASDLEIRSDGEPVAGELQSFASADAPADAAAADQDGQPVMSKETVWQLSEALFGEEEDPRKDTLENSGPA